MTAMHIIRCECCWFRLTILSYTLSVYRAITTSYCFNQKKTSTRQKEKQIAHTTQHWIARAIYRRHSGKNKMHFVCHVQTFGRFSTRSCGAVVVVECAARELTVFAVEVLLSTFSYMYGEKNYTYTATRKKSILTDKYA